MREGWLIKEADIDVSLRRLFEARIRLGLFDQPSMVPYTQIPFNMVNAPAHAALAKRAAEEAIVLLKNKVGKWRRGSESNRRMKVLQTSPLPLGYRAVEGVGTCLLIDRLSTCDIG